MAAIAKQTTRLYRFTAKDRFQPLDRRMIGNAAHDLWDIFEVDPESSLKKRGYALCDMVGITRAYRSSGQYRFAVLVVRPDQDYLFMLRDRADYITYMREYGTLGAIIEHFISAA